MVESRRVWQPPPQGWIWDIRKILWNRRSIHENEGLDLTYESATIQENCENCNAKAQCDVSESLRDGKRRWDMECSCPVCGNLWHTGGPGTSPNFVHAAIISANGETEIHLSGDDSRGAALLKTLREVHDITLTEAKQMADTLRSSGLRGTLVDVELMASKLRKSGFQVRITRAAMAQASPPPDTPPPMTEK